MPERACCQGARSLDVADPGLEDLSPQAEALARSIALGIAQAVRQVLREVERPAPSPELARLQVLQAREWLTPADVNELYAIRPSTLSSWRVRREGPPYSNSTGKILYNHERLRKWLASGLH